MPAQQQPIPPTPPLTSAGFADPTWQRWLEILRKRLVEAYSSGNPIPIDPSMVPTTDITAVFFQLKKVAVISKKDAKLKNLEVLGTLLVDLTTHLVGNVQMDGTLTVNGTSHLVGDTQVDGTLTSTGKVTATNDLAVGGNGDVTGSFSSGSLSTGTASTGSFTSGAAGFNGAAAQSSVAINAACTDLPTAIALLNQIRGVIIANGQAH